ncbi:family 43 glycosylhydrolase [Paenibacillus sp. 2KB_22]|uniref:family 43 glycosylhydrolase n=1 Tax=Paenibacillus sp. 2KB_22 TaxID=3232978 RepID=UPI003F98B389
MSQINGIQALLSGDYPDPSILRVGGDYYMTHSSFQYTPGLLIWHSRNLIDWEPIGHAISSNLGGSIMAPDMVYHEGLYYIYFPANGSNYVVTAEHPSGPWTDPIDLKVGYIDPGHVVDQEGNRFLYLSEGYRIQLSRDGWSTVGDLTQEYAGWRYPKEWLTEGFYLESPKLTYKDGYYYMTCAQGGTAGPATSHMIISARARTLDGPWENSPHNPIVRTNHRSEKWWSKGHGTLVDTPEGQWYIVYHAYEKGYHTLGRQTLIEPVVWSSNGWFTAIGHVDSATDDANKNKDNLDRNLIQKNSDKLGLHWHFFDGSRLEEYHIEDNAIVLTAGSKEGSCPLLCIPEDHSYTAEVTLTVEEGTEGMLGLFYKPGFHYGIGFDGKEIYAFRNHIRSERTPILPGEPVRLRIINDEHQISLSYQSSENKDWTKLDHSYEMSGFHHNVLGNFLSLRIALDAIGAGKVKFNQFTYRPGI